MRNIKSLSKILLIVSILVGAISCEKPALKKPATTTTEDNTSLLSIIENYYAASKTKVDGKFLFESNLTNNDISVQNTVLVGGVFYDKSGNTQPASGPVTIANKSMDSHDNRGTYGFNKIYSREDFYGKPVTFSVTPPASAGSKTTGGASTLSTTVYSPLPISYTNIAARTSVQLVSNSSMNITWNPDANNPNGVIIIAEYLPTLYVNKQTLSNGFSKQLSNSLLVTDNGSYTIPYSFFSGYPLGGHLILWIARGNYTILTNGTYNYSVGGYSAAAIWDVMTPNPPSSYTVTATNYVGLAGFTATYTNTSTQVKTTFTVPAAGGTLGTLPAGTYNIVVSKPGNTTKYSYSSCGATSTNTVIGTLNNVTLGSGCTDVTIDTVL